MAGTANPRQATAGSSWMLVTLVLLVLVMASSFGVIYVAHASRELFHRLEQERRAGNEIQIEWRQLLLERGTLSSYARVETIARERLHMVPVEGRFHVLVDQ